MPRAKSRGSSRCCCASTSAGDDEDQREAAELLHALGTAEALARLGTRPGHALARALLRDTRWDAPAAGDVPVLAAPSPAAVAWHLAALRLRRATRIAAARWAGAALGGGAAGALGGAFGGLILVAAPTSTASPAVAPVLAVIGAGCGAAGGAGVGAGLSVAEAAFRSRRTLALVAGGAIGGGLVGIAAQWLSRWSLAALVGVHLDVGGGLEGLVIGAAAGLGYAASTTFADGGLAAPRGRRRARHCRGGGAGLRGRRRWRWRCLARARRRHRPPHCPGVAGVAGAADAARPPRRRTRFRPRVRRHPGHWAKALLFGAGLAFGLTRRPT